MAQELEDGEFWLPSDFLTDDESSTVFKSTPLKTKWSNDFLHGFGGSTFGFSSNLSSPVDSVLGSTEAESDEDDFVAGLTRKMAHTTLKDYDMFSDNKPKEWKLSTSPQSILCPCKQGPIPNRVTRSSSPPEVKFIGWNLLYTAADVLAMESTIEETTPFHLNKLFAPPTKPSHVALLSNNPIPTTGIYRTPAQSQADIAYLRMQEAEIKQRQMMQRVVWGQGIMEHQFENGKSSWEAGRTQGLSMEDWPTLQHSQLHQQPGSSRRTVFGETGLKKQRIGTGVFLPRNFGTNLFNSNS